MKNISKILLSGAVLLLALSACNIAPITDPNNPSLENISKNASLSELQNIETGIEASMRDGLNFYFDDVNVIGREYYRYSGSDTRYTGDLLGKNNAQLDAGSFYTTSPYASFYVGIKNCNILLTAVQNTTAAISDGGKKAANGFAKTLKAYQLLLVLNLEYKNGIRVDVSNPDVLGPRLDLAGSQAAISQLLDDGYADLTAAGTDFPFSLSSGFAQFSTPASFAKFNRALAARVDVYRSDWAGALTALSNSFFSLTGDLYAGPFHPFSTGGGDLVNPVWNALDTKGEIRVAQPSFITDAEAGDKRLSKVTRRPDTAVLDGLKSAYDVSVYASKTSPVYIIRNEELILIYAEAKAQTGVTADAVAAINVVRAAAGLPAYSGATDKASLITQILKQRRYSLFGEGQRWIDLRRYGLLNTLPIDRPGDQVFEEFPVPVSEH